MPSPTADHGEPLSDALADGSRGTARRRELPRTRSSTLLRGQGPGDLLRAAWHRQDLPGPAARRGAGRRIRPGERSCSSTRRPPTRTSSRATAPRSTPTGQMTYRLRAGSAGADGATWPLNAPGKRHVMVIDEINRANLPKVLGELLFLLEYRDEQVPTLYRPDDPFELPKDLWFIGTMNTADRSIALVDAALRRRFHFVPFFPNHGPMAGLLDRWLEGRTASRPGSASWSRMVNARARGTPRRTAPADRAEPLHEAGSRPRRGCDDLEVQHRAVHRGPVLRRREPDRRASASTPCSGGTANSAEVDRRARRRRTRRPRCTATRA